MFSSTENVFSQRPDVVISLSTSSSKKPPLRHRKIGQTMSKSGYQPLMLLMIRILPLINAWRAKVPLTLRALS